METSKYDKELYLNKRKIGINEKTYFIADIAANHDGDLNRALDLIHLAKEAGADCAKFQHFEAKTIVSEVGFSGKLSAISHQSNWEKSVYEVYDQYHTKLEWTKNLLTECKKVNIDFMTTPYNLEAVELFKNDVPGFKIGSGDITYEKILLEIAKKNKPIFLATGASTLEEITKSVDLITSINPKICIMQCNTNYTGNIKNFNFINLNVLKTFSKFWPGIVLGLSDHTPGHSTVLGAVALGASVIEKHFTDDNSRVGPDHSFAMNPKSWADMVNSVKELELSFGDGIKRIEPNENETVVIQRRALRLKRNMKIGEVVKPSDLIALRPCPKDAITPMDCKKVIGRKLKNPKIKGEEINWKDLI